MADTKNQNRGITLEWQSPEAVPLAPADMLHWRITEDRCYLTIGQVNLPPMEGALPDEYAVHITPIVRLVVSAATLRVWRDMIEKAVNALPKKEG